MLSIGIRDSALVLEQSLGCLEEESLALAEGGERNKYARDKGRKWQTLKFYCGNLRGSLCLLDSQPLRWDPAPAAAPFGSRAP